MSGMMRQAKSNPPAPQETSCDDTTLVRSRVAEGEGEVEGEGGVVWWEGDDLVYVLLCVTRSPRARLVVVRVLRREVG